MNYRFCHRCQAELPPHDEGTLIFCTHCGAPQVLLSEDLQDQIEMQSRAAEDGAAAPSIPRDTRSMIWAGALRCVALAGAITLGLAGLSLLLGWVGLLTWFWAVISPVVVIGLFQARFPLVPITTSFGARLGLLTGISVSTALSIVCTSAALAERIATKNLGDFDKQWAAMVDQLQTRMVEQSGPSVLPTVHLFTLPEFRAGIVLACVAFGIAVLIAITTAGGAFAGFIRSRSRA